MQFKNVKSNGRRYGEATLYLLLDQLELISTRSFGERLRMKKHMKALQYSLVYDVCFYEDPDLSAIFSRRSFCADVHRSGTCTENPGS